MLYDFISTIWHNNTRGPWATSFTWYISNPSTHAHDQFGHNKFNWNWPSGSWDEDSLILSMYLCHLVIISPGKRVWFFIWTNLNPLHLSMLCAKYSWNWTSGLVEEYFKILSIHFCYLVIISPWKSAWPFILANLNPVHPRILCQVSVDSHD